MTIRQSAAILWLLFGMFCARVIAQLVQYKFNLASLPAFESWQGSSLPYPVLLLFQLVIIAVMISMVRGISSMRIRPNRRAGLYIVIVGWIYFVLMLLRLLLGLTLFKDIDWFTTYLPAFFHLVLAVFVLIVGYYHRGFIEK